MKVKFWAVYPGYDAPAVCGHIRNTRDGGALTTRAVFIADQSDAEQCAKRLNCAGITGIRRARAFISAAA